jgi:hypothetical protein
MAASPAPALPPDPDNAALLYYQGFLSLPKLSEEARSHLGDVARGKITPDDQVREDIAKSRGAIHFAEAAAKVPACQWGVQFSQGFDALMPQLAQARFMTFVLVADARVRAADGDYRGALERCLITETFAYHIGDDTLISYLVSISVRNLAYKCIQEVAGQAAGDVELLQWLKNELAKSPINTITAVRPLKFEIEIFTDLMQMKNIEKLAGIMSDSNENKMVEVVRKADAEILRKSRQLFTERMNSVIKVWNTPMSYEQAYSQLTKLENDFDSSDPAAAIAVAFIPALNKVFSQKTFVETQANAIMTGIEILLDHARTGRLADTLPAGLPKDAFSGKDFKYEKTKEGFILHCRDKDLGKNELYQYEFKLNK